jgi:menaquinone-dependent protoporphyrinogen oxidase
MRRIRAPAERQAEPAAGVPMSGRVIILYSTTDGHTRRICEHLQRVIEGQQHEVSLVDIANGGDAELSRYDKIVIGARIRYGRHHPRVAEFIRANRARLEEKPSGFFSVNIVARKPGKNRPENNPYARRFLERVGWRPRHVAVFAGKLNYPIYRFWDRQIIRFIMLLTGGPTDPATVVEYTDWKEVEAFGQVISRM